VGFACSIVACGSGARIAVVDGGEKPFMESEAGATDASTFADAPALQGDEDSQAGPCPRPAFPPPATPPCPTDTGCLTFFAAGQVPRVTSVAGLGELVAASDNGLLFENVFGCGGGATVDAVGVSGQSLLILEGAFYLQEIPPMQSVALDGPYAYTWASTGSGSTLARYDLRSSSPIAPTPLPMAAPHGTGGALVAQGGRLWFSTLGGIFMLPEDAGAPAPIATTQTPGAWPAVFVVGSAALAWVELSTSTGNPAGFFAQTLGSGTAVSLGTLPLPNGDNAVPLALDASEQTLFAATSGGVWSVPIDGSDAWSLIHGGDLLPYFLEADATSVYFDEACVTAGPYQTRRLDRSSGVLTWMGDQPGYPFLAHVDAAVLGFREAAQFVAVDAGIYEVH
jgi:hypothetical protein